ncbi:MAG: gliding motility-associated C-terminal domain-containing protein [Janthinobacterium lividum]
MLRFLLRCALALGLLAGPAAAGAQCLVSPPPATCPQPFRAVDVASGQEVQALCVGRPVRFELSCGRQVDPNKLYYNALPGTNTTPAGCDFTLAPLAGNTFTPGAAGPYAVSELSNPLTTGPTTGIVYVRNFQVYDAPAPRFTLIPCSASTVRLLIDTTLPTAPYDQYFVQVNNGPVSGPFRQGAFQQQLVAAAGSQVTVIGSYQANGLCGSQLTQTVPALATPALVLSRLEVQGPLPGPITLTFSGFTDYYLNQIQRADPSNPTRFRAIVGLTFPTTYSQNPALAGLYRLARYDACGTDSAFSAPLPTLVLSATSANNVNALTWQAGGPVGSYSVLRNGAPLATLPPTATSYLDAAVSCGTTYTYRLQAAGPGGGLSVSNEVAVPTISKLAPPAPLVVASFDLRNRVVLGAALPGGAALPVGSTVAYSRQGGGQDVTFSALAAPALLRDSTALGTLLAAPPCYAAQVLDVCGNRSALGPATCPVLLTAEAADPAGATARLSWSALRGPGSPAQGATYRVLTLGPDGAVLAASPVLTALTYLDVSPPADRQVLRYRMEASGAGLPSGALSYSNLATVVRQPYLAVPNAFTPNGDGLNDVLEVKGRYLAAFSFVVIDRNGQEVFRATDRGQTWDGTIRGHAPANGAYVWRFTMQDEAGQLYSRTGSVSILK